MHSLVWSAKKLGLVRKNLACCMVGRKSSSAITSVSVQQQEPQLLARGEA